MYDRIMIPVDGTPATHPAVDEGIDLARRHDAEVLTIHVVRTERMASVPMETAWPGVTAIARREGQSVMDALREYGADLDIPVEAVLVEGSPSRKIVETARQRDCDLIVMATSGRVGINRLLLGSVTERVVRESPVPVLTVQRSSDPPTEDSAVDANVTG